ncbi:MAG: nucleotidyl transferase AbiEii/AbiGii toxin family protein [Bacteroidetes bacterium]|nr:nucleotidyl transferase AbiEii/AbiGii toxin family protein [Bacteroidota bacterium]
MRHTAEYYGEKLHPLQDGVLKIKRDLKLPLYLTGGTALSRHYLNHRFSDDLDLFVNQDNRFQFYIETFLSFLTSEEPHLPFRIDFGRVKRADAFAQLYVFNSACELKIDFVNDLPAHFGNLEADLKLGPVDSIQNILSNKVSALFRFEPRDYVDVWAISKRYEYSWEEILLQAKHKEGAVDAGEASELFETFPFERLDEINWIEGFDYSQIKEDFAAIAEDIFYGNKNSLT